MAGGYPCCCLGIGSTVPGGSGGSGSSVPLPGGSSGSSNGVIVRGSSYVGTAACSQFKDSVSPAVVRVEISGISSKSCGECSLLNGVYFVPAKVVLHANRCTWELEFPPVCGHYSVIYVELLTYDLGDYAWTILLSDRTFIDDQEAILISDEFMLPGQITIDDVDDVFVGTGSEINAVLCTGQASATALISAVA